MGTGWLINYLTNRTQRTALQKELRQKRIALEKIRKICVDEIEKILKSRNNRARQTINDSRLGTKEDPEDEQTLPIFLVAILCYASYNGIIPNSNILVSIDNCTGNIISCLQTIKEDGSVDNIVNCLPGTIINEADVAVEDVVAAAAAATDELAEANAQENAQENVGEGVVLTQYMKNRKRQPILSLKKQLKLATYNLENIRNYCKKILIELVLKARNSRTATERDQMDVLSQVHTTSTYPSYDQTEIDNISAALTGCLNNSSSIDPETCFSDLT